LVATAPPLPTIKEMAKAVLTTAEEGMTSSEILTAISEAYGRTIDRTSLSPQLSRLKEAGELVLNGERWFTKQHHDVYQQKMIAEMFDADPELSAAVDAAAQRLMD
jgi:NAD(P)H-nitrite reductase large subunit